MKFLKPVVNRFTMVTIALLVQLTLLVLLSTYFESIAGKAEVVIRIISLFVMAVVLNQINNPSIAMTWIVFIVISPVFGSLVYLLVGGKKPAKKMRKRLEDAEKKTPSYISVRVEDEDIRNKSRYLSSLGFGVYKNTSTRYFTSGEAAFPVMLDEIKKAEKFIFLEYFIVDKGEMLDKLIDALSKKAREGVEVRLIYDDVGSLFTVPHNFWKDLEKKGIRTIAFNRYIPIMSAVMNNRDHRKILVIDSCVAFTGGINIADEYINKKEKYGYWKDNALMIKGEGANAFTTIFLQMWNAYRDRDENTTRFYVENEIGDGRGYVQPFSDSPVDEELVCENLYSDVLLNAKEYVYIFTPYLIPDNVLMRNLILAAGKGVKIKLMVPGIPDKKMVYQMTKSYYRPLLEKGIEIYKYTPGFLHAKGFVCDDRIACVGTINMDFRSMYHHFECGCMLYDTEAVAAMREDFESTMKVCEKVEIQKKKPSVLGTTIRAIMRLVAPLM